MISQKLSANSIICVYATSRDNGSLPEEQGTLPPAPVRENTPPAETPAWRRVLIAALVAEGVFLVFYLGGTFLPLLVWPGSLAFLPAGIWLGRKSRRPWVEGAVYGLLTTAVVALFLLLSGFPWGPLYALFLVFPQGILGSWLGARLFSAQGDIPG